MPGDAKSDAGLCRERGWKRGAVLEGGNVRIRITAVGDEDVLAKVVSERHDAQGVMSWIDLDSYEEVWSLEDRDWTLVSPPPPDYGAAVERWLQAEKAYTKIFGETLASPQERDEQAYAAAWRELQAAGNNLEAVHAARPK